MRKTLMAAALAASLPTMPAAEILRVEAAGDVQATMDALAAAVAGAGATVFARIDHAAGAEGAGMALDDAELLVFGNPRLGTPAMQDDPLAGLYLPLRVLVYADDAGRVWLAYEDPASMLADLSVAPDAAYVGAMTGALQKLTGAAAGG